MTPAARVQTSIELLDTVIAAALAKGPPADRVLADWFKANRFAGSKDRRAIRDLVYRAIRVCGPVPDTGRAAMLALAETDPSIATLFDGSRYGPPPIGADERPATRGIAPAWLVERLTASGLDAEAQASLLERAPLDIRVNSLKVRRDGLVLPVEAEPTAAPAGLRLPTGTAVEQWDAYRDGLIEVQDTGSQLACQAVAARFDETVLDLCAGAGGKTLALAAAMGGPSSTRGRLIASDTDRGRLSRLPPRAERAGARIESRLLDPGREAAAFDDLAGALDAVLIDAPCSGSGTWRRNPESRWRLDGRELARLTDLQARLIDLAVPLLKPGGRLVYVTCSLLDEEGADGWQAALDRHPALEPRVTDLALGHARGKGIRLEPHRDGTDGFFIAHAVRL